MHSKLTFRFASLMASAFLLTACGGGGGDDGGNPHPADTFSVGGTVTGLATGATVVLQNNAGNNLTVNANGAFTFTTELDDDDDYAVTVLTQPTLPAPAGQTCTVTNGSGTVDGANVTNVAVTCVDDPIETFSIGGTVTGLEAGATVVLQNNGGDDLTVNADGTFTFTTEVDDGEDYAVTVLTQPTLPAPNGQTCTVTNDSGTLAGASVANVTVTCVDDPIVAFSIGGIVAGLEAGATVVLQNNAANNLAVNANGAFTFTTELGDGANYAVTVLTQPTLPAPDGQTCTVTNDSGTLAGANVTNVTVTCVDNAEQIAPTITTKQPLANVIGTPVQGDVITVTFDEAVDTATVTATSLTLQGPSGAVAGTITFASGDTQAIFTPTARLEFDATYTVTVTDDVTDVVGNALAADEVWSFNTGKSLALGFEHTCARLVDGRVKCWGRNNRGQLGYDDTQTRGAGGGTPNTTTLAAVNLGVGRTAVAIAAGDYHTCVILDNGDSKCWGQNADGELGQGSVAGANANLGDAAGEMAALQPINLGVGRHAVEIVGGQSFTCARLDNDSVKCWGLNDDGQLGQGNSTKLGIAAGDIAAAAAVSLGTGLTPIQLSLGHYHSCAILSDAGGVNRTKCWGDSRWGQLGQGNTNDLGDGAGEMGDNLIAINLGTGLTADYLMATGGHTCAILSDESIKCWGLNTWGAVGLDDGNNNPVADKLLCAGALDCVGDAGGEMANSLTRAIPAGAAFKLTLGFRHSCSIINGGALRCWGSNEEGQLGLGDITGNLVNIGDQAGEIATLANTALKPGKTTEELSGGGFHTCVLNTDASINCWGNNTFGQLGHNNTAITGDGAGEMGASLTDLNLGP